MINRKKILLILLSSVLILQQSSCMAVTGTVKAAGEEKTDIVQLVNQELSEMRGKEFCLGITNSILADQKQLVQITKEIKNEGKQKRKTEDIYSFLQGPKAWKGKTEWSGEWYKMEFSGRRFGAYGCGFCCMANIYSTMSPYEASPIGLFQRATQVTPYYPSSESGAIGWEHIKQTMDSCGFTTELSHKPRTYKKFQKEMKKNPTMIVLVSSVNDATVWQNTPGHYVNIWDYNEKTDDVFLAEPGSPEKNRTRVSLRYVYQALKTSSNYQYLTVKNYQEEKNTWKQNGIAEKWRKPKKK
ncbi:MAG: chaperonin [Lachnospiraceae bacterium]